MGLSKYFKVIKYISQNQCSKKICILFLSTIGGFLLAFDQFETLIRSLFQFKIKACVLLLFSITITAVLIALRFWHIPGFMSQKSNPFNKIKMFGKFKHI